jgi:regulator of protease activity HflC (stomatin/prohibitin superfamily)
MVEQARTLPMSASAVVHRDEALALLGRLRERLHEALDESQSLLGDRAGVVAQGQAEVERLRAEAQAERERLVEASSVHREASAQAERLLANAREQAAAMRAEVEDYVDGKLANMEVVLAKTLDAVQRGRARLSGHSELDDLRG